MAGCRHSLPCLHRGQAELGTPALAFVRAVCCALGLDACLEEEVRELRASLLRLTHTREFAPEADFKVRPGLPDLQSSGLPGGVPARCARWLFCNGQRHVAVA